MGKKGKRTPWFQCDTGTKSKKEKGRNQDNL